MLIEVYISFQNRCTDALEMTISQSICYRLSLFPILTRPPFLFNFFQFPEFLITAHFFDYFTVHRI